MRKEKEHNSIYVKYSVMLGLIQARSLWTLEFAFAALISAQLIGCGGGGKSDSYSGLGGDASIDSSEKNLHEDDVVTDIDRISVLDFSLYDTNNGQLLVGDSLAIKATLDQVISSDSALEVRLSNGGILTLTAEKNSAELIGHYVVTDMLDIDSLMITGFTEKGFKAVDGRPFDNLLTLTDGIDKVDYEKIGKFVVIVHENRESLTDLEIVTISGPTGKEIYSIAPSWAYAKDSDTQAILFDQPKLASAFTLTNNVLSLNDGWYLDFESKTIVKTTYQLDQGQIVDYSAVYFSLNTADDVTDVNIPVVRQDGAFYDEYISFNIADVDEGVTFTPVVQVKEGEYGAVIGTVMPNTPEIFDQVTLHHPSVTYVIEGNQLKLNALYHINSESFIDRDPSGSSLGHSIEDLPATDLYLSVGEHGHSPDNSFGLGHANSTILSNTDQMDFFNNISSQTNLSSDLDIHPNIVVTPVEFTELVPGEVIAELSLSTKAASTIGLFGLDSNNETLVPVDSSVFEIVTGASGEYQIKMKDSFFYNANANTLQMKNGWRYDLGSLPESSSIDLYITALDEEGQPIVTRDFDANQLLQYHFTEDMVVKNDVGSPLWVKDLKTQSPVFLTEEREEHQKNVGLHWNLTDSEIIQYSFINNESLSYLEFAVEPVVVDVFKNGEQYYKLTAEDDVILEAEYISTEEGAIDLDQSDEFDQFFYDDFEIAMEKKIQGKYGNIKGVFESEEGLVGVYEGDTSSYGTDVAIVLTRGGGEFIGDGIITSSQGFENAHRKAFDIWSSYIDVNFVELEENVGLDYMEFEGDWRLGIVDLAHFKPLQLNDHGDIVAYAKSVGSFGDSANIFYQSGTTIGLQEEVSWNDDDVSKEYGSEMLTILHEIGHSLGLKHSFEEFENTDVVSGSSSNIMATLFDQYKYTIMSYTVGRDVSNSSFDYDGMLLKLADGSSINWSPKTPMLFDVVSLQEAYGPAQSSHSGDTIYEYTSEKIPYECIYDTGGYDVLDLSSLSGGSQLDLQGDSLSVVGDDYLIPWKTTTNGYEEFDSMGGILGFINASTRGGVNTTIEEIWLPSGFSSIYTSEYGTYLYGNIDSQIEVMVNADQLSVKTFGDNADTIILNQDAQYWAEGFTVNHQGNEGEGAISRKISDMTTYLKHDLSVDLAGGDDSIIATDSNDAVLMHHSFTQPTASWLEDIGWASNEVYTGSRLMGLSNIDLAEGNDFLNLTGTSSLRGEDIVVSAGSGDDILWLSDANENVNAGSGDDEIIINGGSDSVTLGDGHDLVIIANNAGNVTLTDFNPAYDQIQFHVSSSDVSIEAGVIIVNIPAGEYRVTLTGIDFPDLNDDAFSFM